MKLTFIFMLWGLISYASATYSQSTRLTFESNEATIESVFKQIESLSEFKFAYNSSKLDVEQKVSVKADNETIDVILDKILGSTNFQYKIVDRYIIINDENGENPTMFGSEQAAKTVKGKVTNSLKQPLPGVTVVAKGTTNGIITDIDGNYTISNVSNETILAFSFIGMKPQEIPIQGKQVINVVLEEENVDLDEVIVIGYGTAKRNDYPGSVSSIKMENSPASLIPNLNPLELLKGNVAGLNIGATNTAGGEPSMLIRGQNSISGSNNPLIILDGVIYLGSLSDINPNDIATFNVLKDALSAAAYGSRSANGVIAITTKTGKTSKPTITFSASTAFQKWQNRPEMMNGDQYIEFVNARNSYVKGSTYWLQQQEADNMNTGKETTWLDEVSRTGVVQNYQIAVSGASNGVTYYLSSSYDDNKGIVVGDKFNRISVLGKLNTNINRWLQIGVDASFSKRDYSGTPASINVAEVMSPYGVEYRDNLGNLEKYPTTQGTGLINPLWGVNDGTRENEDLRHNYRLNSYTLLTAPWTKGLTYRINFQNNLGTQETGDFYHENYFIGEGAVTNTQRYASSTVNNYLAKANGSLNESKTYSYVFDNILNYNRAFNKHSVDVTLVATRDYSRYKLKSMTGSDYAANGSSLFGFWGLHLATTQKVNLDAYKSSNIGYLGRLNYSYDNKYFFTGSFRRDGSSVFGENKKWGNFSAVGLAWVLSNEEFLKDFEPLNNLKLKLSWGQNGNQGVGAYSTLAKVSSGSSSGIRYEFSNTGSQIYYGLKQSNMGNSDLGWESTEKWNGGFESVWLKNRLFVDFDLYSSKTTDEIYTPTIPSMNGFSKITSSLGEVHNWGIELTLRTVNIKDKIWNWNTSLTFWLNRNKLVHLDGQDLNNDGIEDDKIADGMFIGKPLNSIYGYVQDGIIQTTDIAYKAMSGASTINGYPKYKDISGPNGTPDGKITTDDRTILGYPQENFRLNFSSSVSYKNFELYVMVAGIFGGGNYFLKSNTLAYMTNTGAGFNANLSYRPYWTTDNPSNIYPAAYYGGDSNFLGLQSRAFVRVQNISLSYTFKQEWMKKCSFSSLKVFCTANNPLISTNWVGGDPEIGTTMLSTDTPVASTYSFGVNVSF